MATFDNRAFEHFIFFRKYYAFQTQGAEAPELELTLVPTLRGLMFNIIEGIMHASKNVGN